MNVRLGTLSGTLSWGAWSQNRGRLGLTVIAIALGVALGTAVHLINYSASAEFTAAVKGLSGDADITIQGSRSGFSENLYPRLARRADVAVASPVLEFDAKLIRPEGNLRIVGIDPFRALMLRPGLLGDAAEHLPELLAPDTVMLSNAAARTFGLTAGETLQAQVGLRNVDLRIVAILPNNDALGQPLAVMDIASAQWAFERLGIVSRIDLRLRPPAAAATFIEQTRHDLPAGVNAVESRVAAEQALALSRAYRVNLNVLALVALFTGAVLVFSTQTLSMLRRRTHFALLRALGLTRRALTLLLVAEAALLGVVGTLIGLLLGIVAARFGLAQTGGDLGAGFFAGLIARIRIDPLGLALIALCGIGASLLGGALPALEAANAEAAQALRAGDEQRALERLPRILPGILIIALGAGLTLMPPVEGLPVFGYASIACLLLGALMLIPAYTRTTLKCLPIPRGAIARLAVQQLRGTPGYTGISLAAILASFSLTVAMLVMIDSFRGSLDTWLQAVLPADLYARAGSTSSTWLDRDAQARLQSADAVRRVVFSRYDTIRLDPARPAVTLIARDLDPERPDALQLVSPQRLPHDGTTPVWISEATRDLSGLRIGERLDIPLGGRTYQATVAGIWRDYVRQGGAILLPRTDYLRWTGDSLANEAWIWLRPGFGLGETMTALRQRLGVGSELEFREPGRIRHQSLATFDRTFAVTYALEVVAVLIGLFGISVGTSAQAVARRREFAVLHHIGMSRRQIGLALAMEGGSVGALGALAGLVVGGAMSLVLIHVINRQSFHWSMELHVPAAALLALSLVLALCSALTAAISARRTLGDDLVQAVKEDW